MESMLTLCSRSTSSRVTRKRSRAHEDEQDLPPAKREPDLHVAEGAGAPTGNASQAQQQEGDGQALERDEEFWFDDGTVILVACDVEFRFYKGLLASVSPVFKQLFANCRVVRNVRMDQEQTYSCPVVHVSDSPKDLRYVLRTCSSNREGGGSCRSGALDFSSGSERSVADAMVCRLYEEREPSYLEISASIRLGRKYKMAALYSQSVEYLQTYFSDTLREYGDTAVLLPPGWKELDAIGVINLARLTGELSLLPSAFVTCISGKSAGTNGIVHGSAQEDGSEEHLSPNDLAICFNSKTSLHIATISAIFKTFKPTVSPACAKPAACKAALSEHLLNLGEQPDTLLDGGPFPASWGVLGPRGSGLGVCRPCANMVGERSQRERKDFWNRLPELLGIDVPGWGQGPAPPPS